ncbi:DNA modification methylase [Bradyrhizobium hipponense]|uniref:DNA modification methylase n=1 Tax=Bradyrhizobium hipponense TaxID=2605638 RepID=A0A5S4YC93_9BRAD|nr:DNA modification methylase [Bradyrhizobium hipponense]TYO62040.1 DNA modification methylase [Bradyrhizobium hipponense]
MEVAVFDRGRDETSACHCDDATLSETDKRAYVLADNRLAEKAGWDNAILAIELKQLADAGFDLDLTGFEAAEVDCIIESFDDESEQPENRIPERGEDPPVSRVGDMWRLGKHVLFCGDATDAAVYGNLMDRERADFIFTDPPYNVRIGGNVSGLGAITRIAHRQDMHLVPFAARAFRAAALVTNGALQQRTAQQFAGDRQLADKLLTRLKGSLTNHS